MRVEDLPVDTSPRSGILSAHLGQHKLPTDSPETSREECIGVGGPFGLWHFIYRSIYLDQLYRAYQKLYASMHDRGVGPPIKPSLEGMKTMLPIINLHGYIPSLDCKTPLMKFHIAFMWQFSSAGLPQSLNFMQHLIHLQIRHLRTDDITCKPVMVVVTPLNISLNFSRVCGAKDPSLANLPSQRLEKQSKTQKEQSNRDTYEVTGILSQLVLFHSYKTKSFPEPEYNALTQAYEKEPFPKLSLSVSRLQEPF
ncbi:Vacuolar fusion protein MON1-like [Vitis vinifera]|uniref:Vacuolar fusion protein MON1-like n=1 Tax=Vitis vinifera TaxID=29760 RepID=A0A438IKY2_VITVI|nr:Vacuolar fusion protein MON1-like [Vitis vinifera]